ncbi:MAG: hypothetical protein II393_04030 [Cytophagales bacterium]|nr:hypothetical protein [Cytophagales bacterium]
MKRIEKSIAKKIGTEKRLTHNEVLYLLESKLPVEILNEYMIGRYNLYMKDIDFLLKTRDKKKNTQTKEIFEKPVIPKLKKED